MPACNACACGGRRGGRRRTHASKSGGRGGTKHAPAIDPPMRVVIQRLRPPATPATQPTSSTGSRADSLPPPPSVTPPPPPPPSMTSAVMAKPLPPPPPPSPVASSPPPTPMETSRPQKGECVYSPRLRRRSHHFRRGRRSPSPSPSNSPTSTVASVSVGRASVAECPQRWLSPSAKKLVRRMKAAGTAARMRAMAAALPAPAPAPASFVDASVAASDASPLPTRAAGRRRERKRKPVAGGAKKTASLAVSDSTVSGVASTSSSLALTLSDGEVPPWVSARLFASTVSPSAPSALRDADGPFSPGEVRTMVESGVRGGRLAAGGDSAVGDVTVAAAAGDEDDSEGRLSSGEVPLGQVMLVPMAYPAFSHPPRHASCDTSPAATTTSITTTAGKQRIDQDTYSLTTTSESLLPASSSRPGTASSRPDDRVADSETSDYSTGGDISSKDL